MKIVNLDQFIAMPAGTVFAKYEPCVFGDLLIKEDSIPETRDFFYQPLVDTIDSRNSDEHFDLLEAAEHKGASVPLDYNCISRDGLYEPAQLFAVWERTDVEGLIARLQETLRVPAALPGWECDHCHTRNLVMNMPCRCGRAPPEASVG